MMANSLGSTHNPLSFSIFIERTINNYCLYGRLLIPIVLLNYDENRKRFAN